MFRASNTHHPERNLQNLVYHFNPQTPWVYFRHGPPLASSVERSRKQHRPKLKKVYHHERKRITARKNRSHREIARMSLLCSCDSGCLMRRPAIESFELIRLQRQTFYTKSYNEQNYILFRQMEVKLCASGRRRVIYKVPSIGVVCRGAFKKFYGFSNAKIKVLLRKIQADGVSIEQDMRGRHRNNAIRLLPEARRAVTDFIVSKNATESHYRRARTQKKYFDSNESMRKMWRDFVTENPNFKSTRSPLRNKGPVISFSTFRNIFHEDLSDLFSFRKARIDTCQFCDETVNKINILSQSQENPRRRAELNELREAHFAHCRESEVRFASMKYDMNVLSNKQR